MNRNKIIWTAAIVVVVIAAIAYSIHRQPSANPKAVTLGVMLPLSGDYAAAGQNIQKGIELAVERYKAAHPGTDIRTVVEDDGYDVKMGLTAYTKLVTLDKVDAILMLSTPVLDAVHADAVRRGIPVICIGVQTVGVGPDNIFQFSPAADAPIGYLAAYLDKDQDFYSKKVAVMYDNSVGQVAFFKAFQQNYHHDYTSMIVNSKDDLRGYAAKIVSGGYGAVMFIETPQNGAIAVDQILALSANKPKPLFAFDAQLQTGFADYGRILGDTNKINGALSMWFRADNAAAFKAQFKAKYGDEPGFLADFGYDMLNTALATYDADNSKWVSNLARFSDPEGVSGGIAFDANGIRIQPMLITEVKNGQLVPMQSDSTGTK